MKNNIHEKEMNDQNDQIESNTNIFENPLELKEDEFTMGEYLDNVNKEILVITKFEKNEQVKKCTYERGYISQEIYICITCSKEKNTLSGICVGCAYKCHENHEVQILYFKRNFRCDCGNSNFCMIENMKYI